LRVSDSCRPCNACVIDFSEATPKTIFPSFDEQFMSKSPKISPLAQAIAIAITGAAISAPVFAQETLPSVTVTATSGAYRAEKDTASAVAPTQSSLYATQPQSVITREFIEQSVAPTAEYSRVVVIAPSLSGNSSNGPGLSETKIIMRGFSDDQYNITFDGIPWGDTNSLRTIQPRSSPHP